MGQRTTVYNHLSDQATLSKCNPENLRLAEDYMEYLASVGRSPGTIYQYRANLNIFWCWNYRENRDKFFVKVTKRDFAKFQNAALNQWKWSPRRVRTFRATLSSLSNYIENMLDDEFPDYRSVVLKIEAPANDLVREKTVFEESELQQILDELCEQGRYEQACMLSLAMNSGRRKSELLLFKVSYFDKKNLICGGALYKTPEKIKTKGRGVNGKPLTVYTLAKGFDKYLNLWLEAREKAGIKSEWLFPKHDKRSPDHLEVHTMDAWAKLFSSIIGRPFYWHSMRHFFTTKLAKSNIPDTVIADIVGWSSPALVAVYNDSEAEDEFDKYFDANGIKEVRVGSITEL